MVLLFNHRVIRLDMVEIFLCYCYILAINVSCRSCTVISTEKKIDFLALAPIPSIMRMRATSSAVISVLFDL